MTTRMGSMTRIAIMARVRVGTEMEMEMEMDEAENRPAPAPTREGALDSYSARGIDHVS
jgi:hypothetical protein